jgi:hypothetical protein
VTLAYDELRTTCGEAVWSEAAADDPIRWRLTLRKINGAFVAALALVGEQPAPGLELVWHSRTWDFFKRSEFVSHGDAPVKRWLPGLGVEPA